MPATRHMDTELRPRAFTPDRKRRLRRTGVSVGLILALMFAGAACRDMNSGNPSRIDPDKCGTVFVPGPINDKGEVDPPGSTVPLDYCEVQK